MTTSLRRGIFIHDVLRLDGQRHLARLTQLPAEELVSRMCVDGLPDDADARSVAIACVVGARQFLESKGLTLLLAERFVRSAYRPVRGAPDLRIRFSGRIDAVTRNARGGLTLLDYKTGKSIPSSLELGALPSSFVYSYLGRCLRDQDELISSACSEEVEILQLLPHVGMWSSACLTGDEMVAGADSVRRMVMDMAREVAVPNPGDYCAYCPLTDTCPTRPQLGEWEHLPL